MITLTNNKIKFCSFKPIKCYIEKEKKSFQIVVYQLFERGDHLDRHCLNFRPFYDKPTTTFFKNYKFSKKTLSI